MAFLLVTLISEHPAFASVSKNTRSPRKNRSQNIEGGSEDFTTISHSKDNAMRPDRGHEEKRTEIRVVPIYNYNQLEQPAGDAGGADGPPSPTETSITAFTDAFFQQSSTEIAKKKLSKLRKTPLGRYFKYLEDREKNFILDGVYVSTLSEAYSKMNPKLQFALRPYNALEDPACHRYFRNIHVRDVIRRTLATVPKRHGEAIEGFVIEAKYHKENRSGLLAKRNVHGSGRHPLTYKGHNWDYCQAIDTFGCTTSRRLQLDEMSFDDYPSIGGAYEYCKDRCDCLYRIYLGGEPFRGTGNLRIPQGRGRLAFTNRPLPPRRRPRRRTRGAPKRRRDPSRHPPKDSRDEGDRRYSDERDPNTEAVESVASANKPSARTSRSSHGGGRGNSRYKAPSRRTAGGRSRAQPRKSHRSKMSQPPPEQQQQQQQPGGSEAEVDGQFGDPRSHRNQGQGPPSGDFEEGEPSHGQGDGGSNQQGEDDGSRHQPRYTGYDQDGEGEDDYEDEDDGGDNQEPEGSYDRSEGGYDEEGEDGFEDVGKKGMSDLKEVEEPEEASSAGDVEAKGMSGDDGEATLMGEGEDDGGSKQEGVSQDDGSASQAEGDEEGDETKVPGSAGGEGEEQGSAMEGEGSAMEGEGSAMEGEGSAMEGEGSAMEGEGSAMEGEGSAVEGEGSAMEGEGSAMSGGGSALSGDVEEEEEGDSQDDNLSASAGKKKRSKGTSRASTISSRVSSASSKKLGSSMGREFLSDSVVDPEPTIMTTPVDKFTIREKVAVESKSLIRTRKNPDGTVDHEVVKTSEHPQISDIMQHNILTDDELDAIMNEKFKDLYALSDGSQDQNVKYRTTVTTTNQVRLSSKSAQRKVVTDGAGLQYPKSAPSARSPEKADMHSAGALTAPNYHPQPNEANLQNLGIKGKDMDRSTASDPRSYSSGRSRPGFTDQGKYVPNSASISRSGSNMSHRSNDRSMKGPGRSPLSRPQAVPRSLSGSSRSGDLHSGPPITISHIASMPYGQHETPEQPFTQGSSRSKRVASPSRPSASVVGSQPRYEPAKSQRSQSQNMNHNRVPNQGVPVPRSKTPGSINRSSASGSPQQPRLTRQGMAPNGSLSRSSNDGMGSRNLPNLSPNRQPNSVSSSRKPNGSSRSLSRPFVGSYQSPYEASNLPEVSGRRTAASTRPSSVNSKNSKVKNPNDQSFSAATTGTSKQMKSNKSDPMMLRVEKPHAKRDASSSDGKFQGFRTNSGNSLSTKGIYIPNTATSRNTTTEGGIYLWNQPGIQNRESPPKTDQTLAPEDAEPVPCDDDDVIDEACDNDDDNEVCEQNNKGQDGDDVCDDANASGALEEQDPCALPKERSKTSLSDKQACPPTSALSENTLDDCSPLPISEVYDVEKPASPAKKEQSSKASTKKECIDQPLRTRSVSEHQKIDARSNNSLISGKTPEKLDARRKKTPPSTGGMIRKPDTSISKTPNGKHFPDTSGTGKNKSANGGKLPDTLDLCSNPSGTYEQRPDILGICSTVAGGGKKPTSLDHSRSKHQSPAKTPDASSNKSQSTGSLMRKLDTSISKSPSGANFPDKSGGASSNKTGSTGKLPDNLDACSNKAGSAEKISHSLDTWSNKTGSTGKLPDNLDACSNTPGSTGKLRDKLDVRSNKSGSAGKLSDSLDTWSNKTGSTRKLPDTLDACSNKPGSTGKLPDKLDARSNKSGSAGKLSDSLDTWGNKTGSTGKLPDNLDACSNKTGSAGKLPDNLDVCRKTNESDGKPSITLDASTKKTSNSGKPPADMDLASKKTQSTASLLRRLDASINKPPHGANTSQKQDQPGNKPGSFGSLGPSQTIRNDNPWSAGSLTLKLDPSMDKPTPSSAPKVDTSYSKATSFGPSSQTPGLRSNDKQPSLNSFSRTFDAFSHNISGANVSQNVSRSSDNPSTADNVVGAGSNNLSNFGNIAPSSSALTPSNNGNIGGGTDTATNVGNLAEGWR